MYAIFYNFIISSYSNSYKKFKSLVTKNFRYTYLIPELVTLQNSSVEFFKQGGNALSVIVNCQTPM